MTGIDYIILSRCYIGYLPNRIRNGQLIGWLVSLSSRGHSEFVEVNIEGVSTARSCAFTCYAGVYIP